MVKGTVSGENSAEKALLASRKKSRARKRHPSKSNGLSKKSIADCLQTRPIDYRRRLVKIRGRLSSAKMEEIDQALRIVFDLSRTSM